MAEVGVKVPGIDVWHERFAGDDSRYVVIGAAARELIYVEHGMWDDTVTKVFDRLGRVGNGVRVAHMPNSLAKSASASSSETPPSISIDSAALMTSR